MNLKEDFIRNILTKIAEEENIPFQRLNELVNAGRIVVPLNKNRAGICRFVGIGQELTVKVNANIGGSPGLDDIDIEILKLKTAVHYGADTVMDLTIGKAWKQVLARVLQESPIPVGTVPVYAAVCEGDDLAELDEGNFLSVIEEQARMGVDFMTVHSGVTKQVAHRYDSSSRIGGIVSRGGKLMYRWMNLTGRDNPLFTHFDEILDIAREYNVTLSLGDGLRPGCLADASDDAQYSELEILGQLTKRCRSRGVSVMIEGPGHVPLNLIKENIEKEKEICDGAPFYVLGPLTTDIAPGYDHITGAIGGAIAAWLGADFLCYLTPAEHLHLPSIEDVKDGVIATKIAAHSGDIAKGLLRARDVDDSMSKARKNLDWDSMKRFAVDPSAIEDSRRDALPDSDGSCTMCGSYCALLDGKDNERRTQKKI